MEEDRAISKSRTTNLATHLLPMLATSSAPFDDAGCIFEVKWDGVRALACSQNGTWRVWGRQRTDYTDRYPELEALRRLPAGTMVDGELVALRDGRPDFHALMSRHSRRPRALPFFAEAVQYVVFDLLYFRGRSLMDRPLKQIRRGGLPRERGHMTVQIQVIGRAAVPAVRDPRLNIGGPQPDVEVVLLGVGPGRGEAVGIAFHVGDELGRADFVDEAKQVPSPVPPRLVAQLGVEEITGAVPYAIAAWIGLGNRQIAGAAVHDVAIHLNALLGEVFVFLGIVHEGHQLIFPIDLREGIAGTDVGQHVRIEGMVQEKVTLGGVVVSRRLVFGGWSCFRLPGEQDKWNSPHRWPFGEAFMRGIERSEHGHSLGGRLQPMCVFGLCLLPFIAAAVFSQAEGQSASTPSLRPLQGEPAVTKIADKDLRLMGKVTVGIGKSTRGCHE